MQKNFIMLFCNLHKRSEIFLHYSTQAQKSRARSTRTLHMTGVAVFKSADFVGLPVHFNTYDLGHINGKAIIVHMGANKVPIHIAEFVAVEGAA